MMKHMRSILTAILGLLVLAPALPVAASPQEEAGFTVRAVLPKNQRNPNAAYFDLRVEPGQTQALTVLVENQSNEQILVAVETVTASTGRGGNLHYSSPGIYDETMVHSLALLAVPEEDTLAVPAHSVVPATITVTVPQEPFEGLLLGAVRFVKAPDEQEDPGDMGIVNRYSYAIGLRLTEADAEFTPDFALGQVQAELINHKAAIVAHIRNPAPMIVEGVDVAAEIYTESGELVVAKSQQGVAMAPNAVFPLTLMDGEGYGFPAGTYTARIRLEHSGRQWDLNRAFTIAEEAAANLNGGAVNQVQNRVEEPSGRGSLAGILTVCAMLAALAVIVLRKPRPRW